MGKKIREGAQAISWVAPNGRRGKAHAPTSGPLSPLSHLLDFWYGVVEQGYHVYKHLCTDPVSPGASLNTWEAEQVPKISASILKPGGAGCPAGALHFSLEKHALPLPPFSNDGGARI